MGMRTDKAGGIEIYSAKEYLRTRHHWGVGGLLLHEFSHAYHDKHCKDGYDNTCILEVKFCHLNYYCCVIDIFYLFLLLFYFIFFMCGLIPIL